MSDSAGDARSGGSAGCGEDFASLRRALGRVNRRLKVLTRMCSKILRATPGARASAPPRAAASPRPGVRARRLRKVDAPTRADGAYPMHLRILYDAGDCYVASLMWDVYLPDGRWLLELDKPLVPSVRVRKTREVLEVVTTSALVASDVVRVHARLDESVRRKKNRSLSNLYSTRLDDARAGVIRIPRKKVKPLYVTFDEVNVVATRREDADAVNALAHRLGAHDASVPPPAAAAAFARSAGVLIPHDEASVKDCLTAMGAPDPPWASAAVHASAAARLATDPRYAPLLATPRSAATNTRVRDALDAARVWRLDTVVMPPRARKASPFADMTLPVLVKPTPAEPPTLRPPEWRLTSVTKSGVYFSATPGHVANRPHAYVRVAAAGDPPQVVGYAYDLGFTLGDDKISPGERKALYQWRPANLTLGEAFVTRLEAVAFDGDAEWSDEQLRHALGLARRAVWAFKAPDGPAARALYARLAQAGVEGINWPAES